MNEVKENKGYVSAEFLKKAAQDVKHIKTRSYQLMVVKNNSQVLDVGCGPAIDTIALSNFIGDKGRIVGVDSDPEMIKKADLEVQQQKITKSVKHVLGNAQALPFENQEFDCVHAERLFQVLPHTAINAVFGEMNRVLKSKGRMVIVDTDWASASVNFSDNELERKLITFFATKMRPNGFAGRQLLELLKNCNYEEVTIQIFPNIITDFNKTPFSGWLTKEALEDKVASKKELDQWNKELKEKTEQGTFLSYVSMLVVAGTKKVTPKC
jgi:ubiquinone/menaquinone biosynthesis C-methylase UbiE